MKKLLAIAFTIFLAYSVSFYFTGRKKGYQFIPSKFNFELPDFKAPNFNIFSGKNAKTRELLKIGMQNYYQGNYVVAKSILEKAYDRSRRYDSVKYFLARTYFELGEYYDAYDLFYDLEENPEFDSVLIYLGDLEMIDDYPELGTYYYDSFLENHPDAIDVYLKDAVAYLKLEDTTTAINYLDYAISYDSSNASAKIIKASVLYSTGNQNEAKNILYKIDKDSLPADAYFYMAIIYEQINPDSAIIFYENAADDKNYFNKATIKIAEIYQNKKQFDKAIDILKSAYENNPYDTTVALKYADAVVTTDSALSLDIYRDIYDYYYDDNMLLKIAECYEKNKDYFNAIKYYSQFITDAYDISDSLNEYVLSKIEELDSLMND